MRWPDGKALGNLTTLYRLLKPLMTETKKARLLSPFLFLGEISN